ncbi:hypothetical protein FB45DRAFT_864375 [Roridomyces roridus]|uniref:Uncharacterized protein n=1 Tax=Roridomyces roridus TaxID=1738132 RepID=A0AAD7C151_9AGAR|nr:hypothetical protein FB45DRAFT_864375 [Roridomyces roridus]
MPQIIILGWETRSVELNLGIRAEISHTKHGNMPLAIDLIAHLVDCDGCPSVLSQWEVEHTTFLSRGYDRGSNLDMSINSSLMSPRFTGVPANSKKLDFLMMCGHVELLYRQHHWHTSVQEGDSNPWFLFKSTCTISIQFHTNWQGQFSIICSMVGYITTVFQWGTDQAMQSPQSLIAQALDCLRCFNDPGVESSLYHALGSYYCRHNDDGFKQAMAWFQKAVATAKMAGDLVAWAEALGSIANIHWRCGQYDVGKINAQEAQRLANISGNLSAEADALGYSGQCSQGLGDYNQAVSDLQGARQNSELCGPNRAYYLCSLQAEGEIYRLQSEYLKARNVFIPLMLNNVDEENHAYAALNVAQIAVEIGNLEEADVELHIATAQKYFSEVQSQLGLHLCQAVLASLQLRQNNWIQAKTMFEECLQASWSQSAELMFYVLERLADTTLWNYIDLPWASRYTVIYLVLSVKHKSKLDIHKALRCSGMCFSLRIIMNLRKPCSK